MSFFDVFLAVARGAIYDTGRNMQMRVLAKDRLDAALTAEKLADKNLSDIEYSHTKRVVPVKQAAVALAMAA